MEKEIIVIDNYDSFTYNLVHILEELLGKEVRVVRNDELTIEEYAPYSHIILSPGPGIPNEAGLLKEVIDKFAHEKKILGVCLGLQAIGEVFGAEIINLDKVYHGIQSDIIKTKSPSKILKRIDPVFQAGRYHSWVIDKKTLPEDFVITCEDSSGQIMGIEHKELDVYAVQFHPESIMTPEGKTMIQNFLDI